MKHVQQSPRFGFWVYVLIASAMAYIIAMSPASAHALWKPGSITPPRADNLFNNLKAAPCGNLPRGNNPAVFQKGTEIMVEWVESINHQGYFKINFSPAGDANFIPLLIKKDANDQNPQFNYPDDQNGAIPNGQVHTFSGLITLPDTVCTDCSLQLIQVMVANNGTESFYYSCSDINLVANDPNDNTPPADVAGFAAAPGDTLVDLSWTNPAADFYRTLVLQSANAIVDVPNTGTEYQVDDPVGDSTVVYVGNGQTHQVTGLNNGATYHFKAFSYDLNANYAAGVAAQAALPAQAVNQAPTVLLLPIQGGNDTATVTNNGGNVQVQAQVTDANPGDQHAYDWTNTDAQLVDLNAAPETLEFDPMTLTPGTSYTVNVAVTDSGNPPLSGAAAPLVVTVVDGATPPPPATPPAAVTSNGTSSGCTVDPSARFSPLFVLMLAGAVFYFVAVSRRRRAQVRTRRHH